MPKRKAKSGKPYEKLVAALERVLAAPGVTIESPAQRVDRITNELREFDVLLTVVSAHHVTRIAIECRDRSRKITVNDVEGFANKCDHTGVEKAVMVSPKGFSGPALTKAAFLGVRCLKLSEAEKFPWLLTDEVRGTHAHVLDVSAVYVGDGELPAAGKGHLVVRDANGVEVPVSRIIFEVRKAFDAIPREHFSTEGVGELGMFLPVGDATVEDCEGNAVPLIGLQGYVKFEVRFESAPLERVEYVEADGSGRIVRAAVAQIDMGGVRGKIMIVEKETGNEITFVPEPRDK